MVSEEQGNEAMVSNLDSQGAKDETKSSDKVKSKSSDTSVMNATGGEKSKKKNTIMNVPLPNMYLSECHKFHTNPILSSPKFAKRTDTTSNTTQSGTNTNSSRNTDANTSPNANNSNAANVLSKALKRKQRLAQYKGQTLCGGPNPSTSFSMNFNLGPGLPCHAVWAPNSNYCKNAELLAIASPLNLNTIINSSGVPSNASNVPLIHNQTANTVDSNSSGSNVYVLVFDEGTFAHGGEFNIADELCELFGLPTEKMPNDNRLTKTRCGMRRHVFHNSHLRDDSKLGTSDDNSNFGGNALNRSDPDKGTSTDDVINDDEGDTVHRTLSKTAKIQEKAQTLYRDLTTKCVQPFAAHLVDELNNCRRVFNNELFDDGRLFNMHSNTQNKKRKNVPPCTDDKDECNKKTASPTRPQLVFHVNLPYSNTSMEVTGLDWNSDGTTLSIIQRRKGSPNAFSAVSSSFTNKKKKPSQNTISPGNTAVSFWSIPEWLHVSCDELKLCDENDDLRYESDGIMFKASKVEDTVGWEVGVTDENRSLFPLWEWYLAKYIFHDEPNPADISVIEPRTRIMMKNCMEYIAYPMELATNSTSATSRGSKKATRNGRIASTNSDNANALLNGDVTCIIWEESPICKIENFQDEDKKKDDTTDGNKKDVEDIDSTSNLDGHDKGDNLLPASKWIAIGTSKGQMILHNGAASYLSYQHKKASRKGDTDKSKQLFANSVTSSSQGRTVVVPLRHKKRITCGAWADNLLIFGHVSTGCLTLVSTFPKTAIAEDDDANTKSLNVLADKSAKVLGSILLPGGRDAVKIQIGHVEENLTILSVNCEGKCLLFYNFPRLLDSTNTTAQTSNITSSPAIELNFSILNNANIDDSQSSPQLKGSANCGNIIFHYLIPDTLLVLVAFSSGYFALVDWVNGVILSDEDIARQSYIHTNGLTSNQPATPPIDFTQESHQDNFLLDVTYHVATSTVACVTQDGSVLVYYIRIFDGCHDIQDGDCICRTGIAISTKTHTRPKTKISSNLVDCDSSIKRIMGTIDFICAHSIPRMPAIQADARKGNLINFSSDGECISISLGDESVVLLSINMEDDEAEQLKQRMAESIYLGKDNILMFFTFVACASLIWRFGQMEQDYAFVEYL